MSLEILAPQHNDDDFSLDPSVIADLWAMEDRHFWHRARNAWILEALRAERAVAPARVLEVGCGSGAVSGALARAGYDVVGVDTAEPLVRKAHERYPSVAFFAADVDALPASLGSFDVLGMFDVLEHLDSPASLLRSAMRFVRPGGLVIATVPALRSLHTVIDDLSGHKKRYESGELGEVFASAGLGDVVERGIFRWTLPMQRMVRARQAVRADALDLATRRALMKDNLSVPSWPVNMAMRWLCAAERAFSFGSSSGSVGGTLLVVGRTAP